MVVVPDAELQEPLLPTSAWPGNAISEFLSSIEN